MKKLVIIAASFGGILLFLLASASANTAFCPPLSVAVGSQRNRRALLVCDDCLAGPRSLAGTPRAGFWVALETEADGDVWHDGGLARHSHLWRFGAVCHQEY